MGKGRVRKVAQRGRYERKDSDAKLKDKRDKVLVLKVELRREVGGVGFRELLERRNAREEGVGPGSNIPESWGERLDNTNVYGEK